MMDVKINCEEGKFKFRVCGILKVNDKYLTVKIADNDFYCLPGGHVELGEDTDHAILREMKEELGYEVELINTGVTVSKYLQKYLIHRLALWESSA